MRHFHGGAFFHPRLLKALGLVLISAIAYGVGAVLQGIGAKNTEKDHEGSRGLFSILRHPYSLAGLALDAVAWLLSRIALHDLPLFAVQTVLAASLAVTVGLSHRLLHTPKRRSDTVAIACTGVGLILVGLAARARPATEPTDAFNTMMFIALPIIVITGIIAVRKKFAPPLLGALSGLSFGFSALSARAMFEVHGFREIIEHRFLYVMIAYGALGIILFTRGVERGQVAAVTAAMWAAEIVPSSIIGFAMLGDRVRPHWGGIAATLGIALTLFATASLARSREHDLPHADPAAP